MITSNIGVGILAAIIGLLVAINPEATIQVVVIILGIKIALNGIFELKKERPAVENETIKTILLIKGFASIIIGALAVCLPLAFFSAIQKITRVFLYIQGLYLLIGGIFQLVVIIKFAEYTGEIKKVLSTAIADFIIASILFSLPANFGITVIRILGVLLLIVAIIYTIINYKNRPIVVEAEIKDEETEQPSENSQE